ncbi:hypothetical protein D9758_016818 [Tetrapyrgos nigripes]|uniref:DUF6532 domain-containing protein n=1 Tax=Tetrapyrgos nigripes TaxID=182062 RepID=A0A8H5F9Q4_9AGAR|nr:hypothetical protein D9758_016818 [Tetrapyrgos nigripes]
MDFSAADFAQEQVPVQGRGQRAAQPTGRLLTHQQELAKNAETAKRRAATLAHNKQARQHPAMSMNAPLSDSLSNGLQLNTAALAQALLANPDMLNLLQSHMAQPDMETLLSFNGDDQNTHADNSDQLSNSHDDTTLLPASSTISSLSSPIEDCGQDTDTADTVANVSEISSDINSQPVIMTSATPTQRMPLRRVNANGLTPTPKPASNVLALAPTPASTPTSMHGTPGPARVHCGRRLVYQSHSVTPDFSSLFTADEVADKENEVSTPLLKRKAQDKGPPDSDDDPSGDVVITDGGNEPAKKKVKVKDAMKLLTSARQRLLDIAFVFFRHLMLHRTPWVKEKSEQADAMALGAWQLALNFLIDRCNYSDQAAQPTEVELNIIKQQLAQYRGEIKDIARGFIGAPHGPAFRFVTPHTIENQNINRALVVELKSKEHSFIFKNRNPAIGEAKVYFGSPIIDCVVNGVWFNKGLKSEGIREGFFPEQIIPIPALALILTAIEFCIDEWQDGMQKPGKFSMDIYSSRYDSHLACLQRWDTYSITSGNNESETRRKQLYMNGRALTGITAQEHAASGAPAANFTADDFAADSALLQI